MRKRRNIRAMASTRGTATLLPSASAWRATSVASHSLRYGSVSSTTRARRYASSVAMRAAIARDASARTAGAIASRDAISASRSARLRSRSVIGRRRTGSADGRAEHALDGRCDREQVRIVAARASNCKPTGSDPVRCAIGSDTPHRPNRLPGRVKRSVSRLHAAALSVASCPSTSAATRGHVGVITTSTAAIDAAAARAIAANR